MDKWFRAKLAHPGIQTENSPGRSCSANDGVAKNRLLGGTSHNRITGFNIFPQIIK